MPAHVAAETQQEGADKWFDKTTWSRSIGTSLLTVAMSQARSTMVGVFCLVGVLVCLSWRVFSRVRVVFFPMALPRVHTIRYVVGTHIPDFAVPGG